MPVDELVHNYIVYVGRPAQTFTSCAVLSIV